MLHRIINRIEVKEDETPFIPIVFRLPYLIRKQQTPLFGGLLLLLKLAGRRIRRVRSVCGNTWGAW